MHDPKFKLTDEVLDTELANNAQLAIFDKPRILAIHKTLTSAGFFEDLAFQIIRRYPPLVRLKEEKLAKTLEVWRGCQFSNTQYHHLFVEQPQLLEYGQENQLRRRLTDLSTFTTKPKHIWRLLLASPQILTDNPVVIQQKIDYLMAEMEVDVTDAVKSGVFSHSLEKLRCRHTLMVRCGVYKPKSKHATPMDSDKNPRVARIMDSSNEYFAKKICGITVAEYNTFCELYAREMEETRIEEEEQNDDTDDEIEEHDGEYDAREKKEYDARDLKKYTVKNRKPRVDKWLK